jgi:hypothetical protein
MWLSTFGASSAVQRKHSQLISVINHNTTKVLSVLILESDVPFTSDGPSKISGTDPCPGVAGVTSHPPDTTKGPATCFDLRWSPYQWLAGEVTTFDLASSEKEHAPSSLDFLPPRFTLHGSCGISGRHLRRPVATACDLQALNGLTR